MRNKRSKLQGRNWLHLFLTCTYTRHVGNNCSNLLRQPVVYNCTGSMTFFYVHAPACISDFKKRFEIRDVNPDTRARETQIRETALYTFTVKNCVHHFWIVYGKNQKNVQQLVELSRNIQGFLLSNKGAMKNSRDIPNCWRKRFRFSLGRKQGAVFPHVIRIETGLVRPKQLTCFLLFF